MLDVQNPGAGPCAFCDKPATCFGAYEGYEDAERACDECCGHGNEDGRCWPITTSCGECGCDMLTRATAPAEDCDHICGRCDRALSAHEGAPHA